MKSKKIIGSLVALFMIQTTLCSSMTVQAAETKFAADTFVAKNGMVMSNNMGIVDDYSMEFTDQSGASKVNYEQYSLRKGASATAIADVSCVASNEAGYVDVMVQYISVVRPTFEYDSTKGAYDKFYFGYSINGIALVDGYTGLKLPSSVLEGDSKYDYQTTVICNGVPYPVTYSKGVFWINNWDPWKAVGETTYESQNNIASVTTIRIHMPACYDGLVLAYHKGAPQMTFGAVISSNPEGDYLFDTANDKKEDYIFYSLNDLINIFAGAK